MTNFKRDLSIVLLSLLILSASIIFGVALGSSGLIVRSEDLVDLLNLRLPRVIAALITGGALSIAGVALQAVLENPLAEPYILGVSGGAVLGGTVGIVFGTLLFDALFSIKLFSFAGAFGSIFFLLLLNRKGGGFGPINMLLTGVIFNGFVSAIVTLFKSIIPATEVQRVALWLSGYISYFQFKDILVETIIVIFSSVSLIGEAGRLNVLSLGEEIAITSGVDVHRLRLRVFLYTSVLTGIVVSITGLVGFVGLIVPQGLRSLGLINNRLLLPISFTTGGAFMIICDLICRLISGGFGFEPPISAITAVIGGPFFVVLLRKYYKEREGA